LLNEGLQELHRLLVDAYETQYAFKKQAISVVPTQTDYELPEDFFRLYGVDLMFAGATQALRPYMLSERNSFKNRNGATWFLGNRSAEPRYALVKNDAGASALSILPANIGASGSILYAPTVVTLVDDADTVELPDGWERYAATYAAIQMLMKEESSTKELRADIAKWDMELIELKATRDSAFPKKIVDMDRVDFDEMY
jgi:hypothetical protein